MVLWCRGVRISTTVGRHVRVGGEEPQESLRSPTGGVIEQDTGVPGLPTNGQAQAVAVRIDAP